MSAQVPRRGRGGSSWSGALDGQAERWVFQFPIYVFFLSLLFFIYSPLNYILFRRTLSSFTLIYMRFKRMLRQGYIPQKSEDEEINEHLPNPRAAC